MKFKKLTKNIDLRGHLTRVIFVVFMASVSFSPVLAYVMGSSNYKIQSDSVNFGGGLGSSANYITESTLGEIGTGDISSANYKLSAGYQAMQSVYIAITEASDVTMSPAIGGVSGGTANGSTGFTVTTDSYAGYQVSIKASSSPALISGSYSFADYAPGVGASYDFTISSSDSAFGFTPEGDDIADKYKNSGTSCGSGSDNTADKCWNGLSTSPEVIATKASANHPSGTLTTLKFRAESGSAHLQPAGVYVATTTVTAVAL